MFLENKDHTLINLKFIQEIGVNHITRKPNSKHKLENPHYVYVLNNCYPAHQIYKEFETHEEAVACFNNLKQMLIENNLLIFT
jgi:hypothetical protein